MIVCVSTRLMAPTMKVARRASQASREGGCGVAGWQGLKMDSGDIADLTPHFTRRPSRVETMPFQEGEDDEDCHARTTYNI
jgi:hypothetical protein